MMKCWTTLFFNLVFLPFFGLSQFKHEIGLSGSWRQFNYAEKQVNLIGNYAIQLNSFTASIGIGVESWYVNHMDFSTMSQSNTGKIETTIGFSQNINHSNVFVFGDVGFRFYFLNQVRDSISLSNYYNYQITSGSRQYIENLPLYYPDGSSEKGQFSYVSGMPFTFLTRFGLGYEFNRFKIRLFVIPYWVRFHYENASNPSITGKKFNFFYDIGLGINYTLPQKKEKSNS